MTIAKLYKHYKLTPQKVRDILKKNNVEVDLRVVTSIPENWIDILTAETGIPKIEIGNKLEVVEVPTKPQKTVHSLEHLKDFKSNKTSKKPIEYDYYFAYVKFVANDKSHAFLRLVENINQIDNENLRDKSPKDIRITKDCDKIDFNQIVIVKKEKNNNNCVLESFLFTGYLTEIKLKNSSFTKSYWNIINPKISSVAIAIRETNELIELELMSCNIFFHGRFFSISNIEQPFDKDKIVIQNKAKVEDILSNMVLSDIDKTNIKFFKKNCSADEYESLCKVQAELDFRNKNYFVDVESIKQLISKWSVIDMNQVIYENFRNDKLDQQYFSMWIEKLLPYEFWKNHLIPQTIIYLKGTPDYFQDEAIIKLISQERKPIYAKYAEEYLQSKFKIETIHQWEALIFILKNALNSELTDFEEIIGSNLTPELKLDLWIEKKSDIFPKDFAILNFSKQDSKTQISIINELKDSEIINLLPQISNVEDDGCEAKIRNATKLIIDDVFKTISFDIETNTNTIYELAWLENNISNSFYTDTIAEGLNKFKKLTSNKSNTFVGQNIVAFDCIELEKHNVIFKPNQIWDTFLIEMLLSPELKNFALKTKHNAIADSKLTLDLFYNQIMRLVSQSEQELELLHTYISNDFKEKIIFLKESINWNWLRLERVEKQKLQYFRPQPLDDPLVFELEVLLESAITKNNIVLVPHYFKKSLFEIENALFFSTDNEKDFGRIDIEKVRKLPTSFAWIKICLERFYAYHKKKNKSAFYGNLGTAIKIKIEDDLDVFSILSFSEEIRTADKKTIILNFNEFNLLEQSGYIKADIHLYIVNKDQIVLENKKALKTLDIGQLINSKSKNHLWIEFAGGVSYVELSKEEAEIRGFNLPTELDNFWIEKYDFSNFKIWGNTSIEKYIEENFSEKYTEVYNSDDNNNHNHLNYPKLKFDPNSNEEFIKFNPETNYRSRYWLFQKEVILQVIEPNTPTLLLVQNEKEIKALELYFRKIGFYIPSGEASIARRMELIHEHKSSKKLIIVAVSNFDNAFQMNYLQKLTIIVESLKLHENYFIAKNSSLMQNNSHVIYNPTEDFDIDEDGNEDEVNISGELKKPLIKDIYLHLKLQTPFINHLKNRSQNKNPENNVWILDPRISDFNEIAKIWNATSRTIIIGDKLDFEKELKVIETFIIGEKPLKELPFDLEKAKEILSDIFLDGNPWYKEQIPYLDDIIPAKTDLVVTLPTGGGKSLLFQGPAILRSAFTNKLTIVVTPLKALMQDQVEALWNKGFYGCVEYLNSDRGTDTQIIYRALAGGEVSLLFITPERFRSNGFKRALNVRLQTDGGLEYAVFDEAHCVSQWGHEFRPDYFNGAKEINYLKKISKSGFPLLLFSATVSKKIYEDFNTIFS